MSADKKFDLGDYIEVKDRIRILYELYPQARLVTESIELTRVPDDKPRVIVKALAYRTPDDPHPGTGYSWLELPGTTSYTRGSEIENAETSAWGRAIASLGILIDRSIASAQEVENKKGEPAPEPKPTETETLIGEATRTGKIAKGDGAHNDLQYHLTADGHTFMFKLEIPGKNEDGSGKNIAQVWAEGELGETMFAAGLDPAKLRGERAVCSGRVYAISHPGRTTYYRMRLTRLEVGEFIIPPNPITTLPAASERPETDEPPLSDYQDDAELLELPFPASLPRLG